MLGFILYLLVIGVVAGFLARLLVPGRDPMSAGATILLGIIGSFIGGFIGWAIFGKDFDEGALQPSGVLPLGEGEALTAESMPSTAGVDTTTPLPSPRNGAEKLRSGKSGSISSKR